MEKNNEESALEKLKEKYKIIQKKYSLPSFESMNEDFQIERISETETDILIREIRKYIIEKISNYLRFIETILNPSNSPMFVFSIVKSLNTENKEILNEMYKKLSKYEIEVLALDTEFSEHKEAEFIKNSYSNWQLIKKDFLKVIEFIKNNINKEFQENKKSYFN